MKHIAFLTALLLALFAIPAHAAGLYLGADYNAVLDNLDVGVSTVGAGLAFEPAKNITIEVGANYGIDASGSRYLAPFEDAWTADARVRWRFLNF